MKRAAGRCGLPIARAHVVRGLASLPYAASGARLRSGSARRMRAGVDTGPQLQTKPSDVELRWPRAFQAVGVSRHRATRQAGRRFRISSKRVS